MVKNISNRLGKLQSEYMEMILKAEWDAPHREDLRDYLLVHSNSCSQLAKILAMMRKVDVELAAIIGLIHDIGKIYTGKKENHAIDGYEPSKELLKKTGDFSDEEIDLISNAVKNHSDKASRGTWADEMAKDVDVLDCMLFGREFKNKEAHRKRVVELKKELGIE